MSHTDTPRLKPPLLIAGWLIGIGIGIFVGELLKRL